MLSSWIFARHLTVFHIILYYEGFGHLESQGSFGSGLIVILIYYLGSLGCPGTVHWGLFCFLYISMICHCVYIQFSSIFIFVDNVNIPVTLLALKTVKVFNKTWITSVIGVLLTAYNLVPLNILYLALTLLYT